MKRVNGRIVSGDLLTMFTGILSVAILLLVLELWYLANCLSVQLVRLEKQLGRLVEGAEYVISQDDDVRAIRERLERLDDNVSRATRSVP